MECDRFYKQNYFNKSWLGHSNYNTTANIYAHLDSNSMNESANAISNVLSTDKIKNVLATA